MNTIAMIALLLTASAVGWAIMIWAVNKGRASDAEITALAARRNWTLKRVAATTTEPGYLEIFDPALGWHLRMNMGDRRGTAHETWWRYPKLSLHEGLAVYAPSFPEKTQQMFNLMMDKSGGLGRVLLASLFKGLGPDARNIRAIEDDDPATLMSTPGAEDAFDAIKGADALHELNQFGETPADVPYFVRDKNGLTLRINKNLRKTQDLEAFIDLAVALAQQLDR